MDLSKANVVTLYLLPSLNVKLIPQLEKLKPGSRIVAHDFDMRGVTPDKVVEVDGESGYGLIARGGCKGKFELTILLGSGIVTGPSSGFLAARVGRP